MFKYDKNHQSEISFPVGGIGAGCIGLAGNGRLVEWEIFNRPNKCSQNGYSHFAVKCERGGELLDAKILNSDLTGSYLGSLTRDLWEGAWGWGPPIETLAGMPHFADGVFTGIYPFARVDFADASFPGQASLSAFNPFIPLDDKNSSLPAAFYEVEIINTNGFDADYTVVLVAQNPYEKAEYTQGAGTCGMYFESDKDKDGADYGNISFIADRSDCESSYQENWYRGGWYDPLTVYWDNFTNGARFKNRKYNDPNVGYSMRTRDHSLVALHANIKTGESRKFRFIISWSVPNCENYWNKNNAGAWKNYYVSQFKNSRESADYCMKNWDALKRRTEKFTEILLGSSLPEAAAEAVISNLAILKSPTVRRLENGELYGFEGVSRNSGICEGSCTHVWNYAYAFPFLFPKLERSMRSLDYKYNTDENGGMRFRLQLPLGSPRSGFRPCADGQFGGVIKTYREWKISGDDEWLKSVWPNVKRSIEYAWSPNNLDKWDADKDGVLEGRQHHTLDMELFGPNSWLTGFYLGALKAGAEMAEYLGETESAALYRELFGKGSKWVDENLFNGEYYHQRIELSDKSRLEPYLADTSGIIYGGGLMDAYWNAEAGQVKYQIKEGCEIQQVMAQWHANICGLGQIFDKGQVKTALKNLYKYNFKSPVRSFANPCRNYCLNDESGLVIATWHKGVQRPAVPLPYEGETQNGYEYQALIHMIQEGLVDEGMTGVAAIRARYDGAKRNPWSEIECGSNYARSMASYSLVLAFSGFEFDMPKKYIGFNPVIWDGIPELRKYFWSVEGAWGEFEQDGKTGRCALTVCEGAAELGEIGLPGGKKAKLGRVVKSGERVEF